MRVDLAVLKALADDTRYAVYRELAIVDAALSRAGSRRSPRRARQHGPAPPRAAARRRPRRRRGGAPRHRRPAPAPLLPRRRRPRLGFDPPAHALLAGLLAALAERVGADPTTPPTPAMRGGSRPACARDPAVVPASRSSRSCTASASSRRSEPGDGTVGGRRPDRVPPLPVPRARRGVPRARVQPPPRAVRRRCESGRRGKSRGVRDVVRPRAVPCDRGRRVP